MSVTELPIDAPEVERPAGRLVLVATLAAAIAVDVAVRGGVAVLAGAIAVLVASGFLLASGTVVNRQAQAAIAGAPLFGMWLAVRTSPWLVPLDVLAAGGLLVLAASLSSEGSVFDLRIGAVVRRGLHALFSGLAAPVFVAKALAPLVGRDGRRMAVVRGAILAAPIVLVVGLLLSSADAVFASFFRVSLNPASLAGHAVLLVMGGWGMAGLLRLAAEAGVKEAVGRGEVGGRRSPIGPVEAITVLSCLVAVFAAFAVSQVVALSGGGRRVIETAGLSYADYARGGFFQLLAVAAITLATLTALRTGTDLGRARDVRRFMVLAEVAVGLTLLIVCVALRRLHLYEQAFGLTMLRLYSTVFAVWIAGVFVLLGVSLAGVGQRRPWLLGAATGLGLVGLLALNAANPEAVVVRHNLSAVERTGRFDAGYLGQLSDDAVPELVSGLPGLDERNREAVIAHLCAAPPAERGRGWWTFNGSSDAATEARNGLC
ncbi:MAG TPA: DUF4173 domain-containing protein [Acidimicrobiales bacterium]|nr:DUF4173 domain-containing protein [Acidimicrobiales bacterium]